VLSDLDMPPFDKSAMDGFAVRASDVKEVPVTLEVIADVPAGSVPDVEIGPGQAAAVMTGAPVPKGADAVVMVEWTSGFGEPSVVIERSVSRGVYINTRGEVVRKGTAVLKKGAPIGVEEISLLAMAGTTSVPVYARPTAAVLATGDELVPPDAVPGPAQIRNCNSATLLAFLEELGVEGRDLGIVRDDIGATRAAVEEALEHDVVLITGGVSVGTYDFVIEVLEALGVTVHFSRVAMKPGKPTVFGTIGDKMVFALPGNPVSATVTARVLVAPVLGKRCGIRSSAPKTVTCRLEAEVKKKPDRLWFVPGVVTLGEQSSVMPVMNRGSADILSAAAANALIVAPRGETHLEKGTLVEVVLGRFGL
jgi:molybdopterin molybdotransferase